MVSSIESGISRAADVAGFIPVVSTVTGLMRVVYGLAKLIFNAVRSAINPMANQEYQQRMQHAKIHIKLGCLEAIPGAKLILVISLVKPVYEMLDCIAR